MSRPAIQALLRLMPADTASQGRHVMLCLLHRVPVAFVLAMLVAPAVLTTGCERPCAELASQLCADTRTEAECELWRERTARVSPKTCQAALERLSRAHTR